MRGVSKPVPVRPDDRSPAFIPESPDIDDVVGRVAEGHRQPEPYGESPALQLVFKSDVVSWVPCSTCPTRGEYIPAELQGADRIQVKVLIAVPLRLPDGPAGKHRLAQQGAAEGDGVAVVGWGAGPTESGCDSQTTIAASSDSPGRSACPTSVFQRFQFGREKALRTSVMPDLPPDSCVPRESW